MGEGVAGTPAARPEAARSPAPAAAPASEPAGPALAPKLTLAERIRMVGGLIAVAIGIFAIALVAVVAILESEGEAATVAGTAAAAIGSIVGAYFGLKVGTDQSKQANEKAEEQAAATRAMALMVPEDRADEACRLADEAMGEVRERRRPPRRR